MSATPRCWWCKGETSSGVCPRRHDDFTASGDRWKNNVVGGKVSRWHVSGALERLIAETQERGIPGTRTRNGRIRGDTKRKGFCLECTRYRMLLKGICFECEIKMLDSQRRQP